MTGIAGCCARAVSGHVAAAAPQRVINSRRLMSDIGFLRSGDCPCGQFTHYHLAQK
jgi:hypothetical protein